MLDNILRGGRSVRTKWPTAQQTQADFDSGVEVEEKTEEEAITQPFDPTLIRVEPKVMTLDLLVNRIKEGEVDLLPGFQRRAGLWKDGTQSRLVESILIRIPLPAFYMDATNEDRWLVVDGLQRLTTLKRFVIEKSLTLTGLEFLTQFNGKTYDDLPRNFKRRISETQVTVYLIEKGTPAELKFNIFKRINTGGLALSAQEIRHALNQGAATQLLETLAGSKVFRAATGQSVNPARMDDRECVLRFLGFIITSPATYAVKDLDAFLNEMMEHMNRMDETQLVELGKRFERAMKAAQRILGRDAFRKKYALKGGRFPINKALFEAWAVNLDSMSDDQLAALEQRKAAVLAKFVELMHNRDFEAAVSAGTGDVKKVRRRFAEVGELLREVLQ